MKLLCWDIVVADDVYLVDLDFLFLVDVDINDELVRLGGVVALHDVYLGILESFVAEELLDDDIEALIEERQAARKAKNFARADEIRDMLADKGIILEDTRAGVKWKRA